MQLIHRAGIAFVALSLSALALGGLAGCDDNTTPTDTPVSVPVAAVDGARIAAADAEPGSWMSYGRDYSEQRFSPLTQITDENVGELGLAWHVDLETSRGVEATPIVVDGVMYTTSAWSIVYAIDPRDGTVLWTYDPQVPKEWGVYACCDVVNRGVAVWDGKVYVGTLDGYLAAIDAETGKELWKVNTIDRTKPYTITGAPRIVKGKVIIGNGGAEFGVRGYLTAYDAQTGDQAWRFYTVPGNPADGFENDAMEQAADTWKGEWWTIGGGGTVWDAMAYDPDLDMLYIGVGNGSPWNQQIRSPGGGDNLYLSSIVAVRPDTGDYVCHYQTTPGETWDYTATQHIILADLDFGEGTQKVMMQAPKNGFFYVLNREDCSFISAEPYVPITWATHVDPATGRPVEIPEARFLDREALVSPSPYGGHNWHPMSFSKQTGLVYIPVLDMPSLYGAKEDFSHTPGRWNTGTSAILAAMPDDAAQRAAMKPLLKGRLAAWDPIAQKEVWRVEHNSPWNGGLLSTAGNLVFQGTATARFVAYSADKGEELWAMDAQTGIVAPPVTYEVDGEQYLTVMVGWGGAYPLVMGRQVEPEDRPQISRVLTFKLGADGALPELDWTPPGLPEPPADEFADTMVTEGRDLYHSYCQYCHGDNALGGGLVPDLRYSGVLHDLETWDDVTLNGMLAENGMAAFGEYIGEDQSHAIRAYIIDRARKAKAELQKLTR